jgi:hypothetical protein
MAATIATAAAAMSSTTAAMAATTAATTAARHGEFGSKQHYGTKRNACREDFENLGRHSTRSIFFLLVH